MESFRLAATTAFSTSLLASEIPLEGMLVDNVHPHALWLTRVYGMIGNFVLLNIRRRLISVFVIFVIATAYENFSITKISITTV